MAKAEDLLACSFCLKSQKEVKVLIAGPTAQGPHFICEECILVAVEVLEQLERVMT